jgi:aldehyde:ferredoxin oxidoreductase
MLQPVLTIDLTTRKIGELQIPESWQRKYVGGATLGARLLYELLTKELDALSPEAPLLFITGPLTGTSGPTTGRFEICGKSPATGLWAESSIGGFWGPELRKAGYDGLLVTGKAEEPVYLWIQDGHLEFRPAAHLWGRETYETQDLVKAEVEQKGTHVCVIGPAGEKRVLYASILCDHGRLAGRTGLGAVMGAKNLKAVAVHGTRQIPVLDLAAYAPLRSDANHVLKQDNQAKVLHELGTASPANYSEYLGSMPVRYYSKASFPDVDNISGARMSETILVGTSACQGCVIACGRVVKLKDGEKRKGPEYETIAGFGPNLLISDLAGIVLLGEQCDRYGMDTISASNTIGLAFMLYDKGIITAKDTGGLELTWGSVEAVAKLLEMIAKREGVGNALADGSLRFARRFGAEEEAVQVNGLEVAYHDPRGLSGMALSYATSPRGACHNQPDYFFVDWGHSMPEIGVQYLDRLVEADKGPNVARFQNFRAVFNALTICIFANVEPEMMAKLVNAACGLDWDVKELMRFGERGMNLKRLINMRMGLDGSNDRLPKRLLEPYEEGGSAGFAPDLQGLLYGYYMERGWDPSTGLPTGEKLAELGLDDLGAAE